MRADRLISLLLFLQARGRVTASEVAVELEVSLSTARRDLEALSSAGVPVYVQPGRGGGWQLIGGAKTNLTGFSKSEADELFWRMGTTGVADPVVRTARQKVIQALPGDFKVDAGRLATSIHYDHATWGADTVEAVVDLDSFRHAVISRRRINVVHNSRKGVVTACDLAPLGLVAKAGVWYLIADGEQGIRSYRIDRLGKLQIAETTFEPPSDFNLVDFWHAHVEWVEDQRSQVVAVIRVAAWIAPIMQQQFGRYCRRLDDGATDPVRLEVRAHLIAALAEQLAGWGSRVEIITPDSLRAELSRIGGELLMAHER